MLKSNRFPVVRTCLALSILLAGTAGANSGITYTFERFETPLGINTALVNEYHDGKLYVAGGMYYGSNSTRNIWAYDIASQTWALQGGKLPYGLEANEGFGAAVVGDSMVISPELGPTANNGWGRYRSVIEYDLANPDDNAVQTARFPYSIFWASTAAPGKDDDTAYFFGGWRGGGVNRIFRYTPSTNALTQLPATLSASSTVYSRVVDADGNIILLSGNYAPNRVNIFDPDTETVIYANNSALPAEISRTQAAWRLDHAGGSTIFINKGSAVYEFDSATRTFTPADFTVPTEQGWYLNRPVVDPASGKVYSINAVRNGSDYTSYLLVGTPSTFDAIPEPATLLAGLAGLAGVGGYLRRRGLTAGDAG